MSGREAPTMSTKSLRAAESRRLNSAARYQYQPARRTTYARGHAPRQSLLRCRTTLRQLPGSLSLASADASPAALNWYHHTPASVPAPVWQYAVPPYPHTSTSLYDSTRCLPSTHLVTPLIGPVPLYGGHGRRLLTIRLHVSVATDTHIALSPAPGTQSSVPDETYYNHYNALAQCRGTHTICP
eukprot:772269-Rhodomonas_salina.3